jgi:hypothetical protein
VSIYPPTLHHPPYLAHLPTASQAKLIAQGRAAISQQSELAAAVEGLRSEPQSAQQQFVTNLRLAVSGWLWHFIFCSDCTSVHEFVILTKWQHHSLTNLAEWRLNSLRTSGTIQLAILLFEGMPLKIVVAHAVVAQGIAEKQQREL